MKSEQQAVLIVDDEASVRDSLSKWFEMEGYLVQTASDGVEALARLAERRFDVAIVDLKMPKMDGVELQRRMHESVPELPVIILTAYGSVQSAVEVLKHGAFDYLAKPVDPDDLSRLVRQAVELHGLRAENTRLRDTIDDRHVVTLVGESAAMRAVREAVDQAARSDVPLLILGEPGTGRQLVARAVHAASRRRYFPLIPLHCATLAPNAHEQELFGVAAAETGGPRLARRGKLELASGGTLLISEIGRLSARAQSALLDALDVGTFGPIGGSRRLAFDCRLIATSSEPLGGELYQRLAVLTIECPPLRERPEDIESIARHLLQVLRRQLGKPFSDLSAEALEALRAHRWPGNVRELENAIERALVVGTPPLVEAADLLLGAE